MLMLTIEIFVYMILFCKEIAWDMAVRKKFLMFGALFLWGMLCNVGKSFGDENGVVMYTQEEMVSKSQCNA